MSKFDRRTPQAVPFFVPQTHIYYEIQFEMCYLEFELLRNGYYEMEQSKVKDVTGLNN
jgi:hypothetical protein